MTACPETVSRSATSHSRKVEDSGSNSLHGRTSLTFLHRLRLTGDNVLDEAHRFGVDAGQLCIVLRPIVTDMTGTLVVRIRLWRPVHLSDRDKRPLKEFLLGECVDKENGIGVQDRFAAIRIEQENGVRCLRLAGCKALLRALAD